MLYGDLTNNQKKQRMTQVARSSSRPWTLVGLAIALLAMPLVMAVFNGLAIPRTTANIMGREAVVIALAVCLLVLIRRKEHLGLHSVGLRRSSTGNFLLWVVITLVGVAAAIAASLGMITFAGWTFGSGSEPLPLWVTLIVVMRAGFVEELFYRGYAIERLESLTGNRLLAVGLPLLLFALFHYRQGWAGITIALLTGAVLTAVYLYKRNLWITITAHFLVDFVPNVLLPLVSSDS
jgi:membrane protease YdiL (CAAX protease family)